MACKTQYYAISAAIIASLIGYLLYAPHSEGIQQMNRVRLITVPMKLAHLIGITVEFFGLSNRVVILRKTLKLATLLKNKEIENANLQDTFIENIPVRIARPQNDDNDLPALIYFHGGGFYFGSVDSYNSLTSTIARLANIVVISVNYRLAPEHPFPAGLDDCYTVAKYVLEYQEAKSLRIDPTRIALGGDSAGGSLVAIIAMRFAMQPVSIYSPRLQILIYPSLQFFDLMLPSYREKHFQFLRYTIYHKLSVYLNETFDQSLYTNKHTSIEQKHRYRKYVDWSLIPMQYRMVYKEPIDNDYQGDSTLVSKSKMLLDPEISPLLVEDEQLAKLPSSYMLTVGHDPLRDEAFIYANRLKRVGVQVVHNHYESAFHGSITLLYGRLELYISRRMVHELVNYIKENL